jgi:hypothetical protein
MACCAARNSNSPSAPTVPPQKTDVQNQVSLLTLAFLMWSLPEYPADSISSSKVSPLMATGMPLYARHCVLLL